MDEEASWSQLWNGGSWERWVISWLCRNRSGQAWSLCGARMSGRVSTGQEPAPRVRGPAWDNLSIKLIKDCNAFEIIGKGTPQVCIRVLHRSRTNRRESLVWRNWLIWSWGLEGPKSAGEASRLETQEELADVSRVQRQSRGRISSFSRRLQPFFS